MKLNRKSLLQKALAEVLEERRMFAAGFPGISLRAATLVASGPLVTTPVSNVAFPESDIRNAATNGADYFTNYVKLDSGDTEFNPAVVTNYPTGGITLAKMRAAYGLNNISFNGVVGDGTGQTIAIIDAYDDPDLVSSTAANWTTSDLYLFDRYTGISAYQTGATIPTFTKVNQTGGTSYPTQGVSNGWEGEIILDVEWAHVMAPKANIVLVEASSASGSPLDIAARYGATVANIVSMSFGGTESSLASENSEQATYFTPANNKPVTFLASTGDAGANGRINPSAGSDPAFLPNIVAIGGTRLNMSGNTYLSETPYNTGVIQGTNYGATGGGYSSFQPLSAATYQTLVTTPSQFSNRMIPDVSLDGDLNSGVYVYDTFENGFVGLIGGTSLSAPMMAGVIAVVNQGRAQAGLNPLSSIGNSSITHSGTLTRLYELPTSDFHDITTGTNSNAATGGYSSSVGYDLTTGRGTPVGAKMLLDLAGGVNLAGKVFNDSNGDSTYNGADAGISGATVYLDFYNGSSLVSEVSTTTDANGTYAFSDLVGGASFVVRVATPNGTVATGVTSVTATGSYNTTVTQNFGFFPTGLTSANITVQNVSGGTSVQFYTSATATGSAQYSISKAQLPAGFTLNGTGGNDVINIDLANGNPLSGVNLTYAGAAQATSDTLVVTGTSGSDTVSYGASTLGLGAGAVLNFTGVEAETFVGNGGGDVVSVAAATVTLTGSQVFNSLSLSGGSKVTLSSGGSTLYTKSLTTDASQTLDLTDGRLIYDYSGASPLSTLYPLLNSGYAGGAWTGKGLVSSLAATNTLTGLGVAEASDLFRLTGSPATGTYAGTTVDATTLIIRYTYKGDTDLNGQVDGSDVANALAGLHGGLTGWVNGDVDYDGTVTQADYSALLTVLRTQGTPIT